MNDKRVSDECFIVGRGTRVAVIAKVCNMWMVFCDDENGGCGFMLRQDAENYAKTYIRGLMDAYRR